MTKMNHELRDNEQQFVANNFTPFIFNVGEQNHTNGIRFEPLNISKYNNDQSSSLYTNPFANFSGNINSEKIPEFDLSEFISVSPKTVRVYDALNIQMVFLKMVQHY